MSLARLLSRTVTVQRRGAGDPDVYGNTTAELVAVAIVGGYIEQTDAAEVRVGRTTYSSTHLVMLEAGTPVAAGDRLLIDGDAFEVLGPPWNVDNPRTGVVSHVQCRARATEG